MQIEGIPDGWELVRIGVPKAGDWMVSPKGKPDRAIEDFTTLWPIIRKIEKPKRYRPFANAAEFEPHREKWLSHDGVAGAWRIHEYNDESFMVRDGVFFTFEEAFKDGRKFEDGTPFGVEVIDD